MNFLLLILCKRSIRLMSISVIALALSLSVQVSYALTYSQPLIPVPEPGQPMYVYYEISVCESTRLWITNNLSAQMQLDNRNWSMETPTINGSLVRVYIFGTEMNANSGRFEAGDTLEANETRMIRFRLTTEFVHSADLTIGSEESDETIDLPIPSVNQITNIRQAAAEQRAREEAQAAAEQREAEARAAAEQRVAEARAIAEQCTRDAQATAQREVEAARAIAHSEAEVRITTGAEQRAREAEMARAAAGREVEHARAALAAAEQRERQAEERAEIALKLFEEHLSR